MIHLIISQKTAPFNNTIEFILILPSQFTSIRVIIIFNITMRIYIIFVLNLFYILNTFSNMILVIATLYHYRLIGIYNLTELVSFWLISFNYLFIAFLCFFLVLYCLLFKSLLPLWFWWLWTISFILYFLSLILDFFIIIIQSSHSLFTF